MDTGPAVREDIPQLCHLLGQLFDQEEEFIVEPEKQRRGLQMIMDNPDHGQVLVGYLKGKPVAMVTLLYTVSTALGGRVCLLEDMVVDQAYRQLNLGTRMLEYALDYAANHAGALRVTLLTDSDNSLAQKFYTRQGFVPSAMLVMRKQVR